MNIQCPRLCSFQQCCKNWKSNERITWTWCNM